MAVTVFTANPRSLRSAILAEIAAGGIDTWVVESRGYLTHHTASGQWEDEAFFRIVELQGILQFDYLRPEANAGNKTLRGIYHGRLTEMLVTHFSSNYKTISVF